MPSRGTPKNTRSGRKPKTKLPNRDAADELIAAAKQKIRDRSEPPLSAEAVKAVAKILEWNDSLGIHGRGRVNLERVVAMLRREFNWQGGRDALERVCHTQLGRQTWKLP